MIYYPEPGVDSKLVFFKNQLVGYFETACDSQVPAASNFAVGNALRIELLEVCPLSIQLQLATKGNQRQQGNNYTKPHRDLLTPWGS
jgi:hypothetical protein